MTGKRALILGSAGMLGSELVRSAPSALEVSGATRAEADVTNLDSLRSCFARSAPKIVINAAAYTAVDGAETERAAAFAVNACGARNVAIACREAGARLLHVSTDFVFDGTAREPYAEWDLAESARRLRRKQTFRRARGHGRGRGLADRPHAVGLRRARKHFVGAILKAARERDRLTVVADQHGCPTSTHDLAPECGELPTKAPAGSTTQAATASAPGTSSPSRS